MAPYAVAIGANEITLRDLSQDSLFGAHLCHQMTYYRSFCAATVVKVHACVVVGLTAVRAGLRFLFDEPSTLFVAAASSLIFSRNSAFTVPLPFVRLTFWSKAKLFAREILGTRLRAILFSAWTQGLIVKPSLLFTATMSLFWRQFVPNHTKLLSVLQSTDSTLPPRMQEAA